MQLPSAANTNQPATVHARASDCCMRVRKTWLNSASSIGVHLRNSFVKA